MVGEVCFTGSVETWNGRHQFVVDPKPAHGVVRRWVNTHRNVIWILPSNALVHIEQVAVSLGDGVSAESPDRFTKVEVHTVLLRSNALTGVNRPLCRTGRNVTRREVAKARVETLEVVVTLVFRNEVRFTVIACNFWNPDTAVVAE